MSWPLLGLILGTPLNLAVGAYWIRITLRAGKDAE